MSASSIRIPESMHRQLRKRASEEGVSINHFVTLAIAEKLASLSTLDYLLERGKGGSREKLLAVLEKAPDIEPDEHDRL